MEAIDPTDRVTFIRWWNNSYQDFTASGGVGASNIVNFMSADEMWHKLVQVSRAAAEVKGSQLAEISAHTCVRPVRYVVCYWLVYYIIERASVEIDSFKHSSHFYGMATTAASACMESDQRRKWQGSRQTETELNETLVRTKLVVSGLSPTWNIRVVFEVWTFWNFYWGVDHMYKLL